MPTFPGDGFERPVIVAAPRAVGDDGFRDSGAAPALHGALASLRHPFAPDPPSPPRSLPLASDPPSSLLDFIPPAMTNVKPNSHRRVARSDVVRALASSFWEVRAHPRLNRSIGIPSFDPGRRRDPRMAPTGRAPSVPPEIGFRPGLTRPDPRPSDPPLGSRVTRQTTATCETTPRSRSSWRSTASPRSCCSAARC